MKWQTLASEHKKIKENLIHSRRTLLLKMQNSHQRAKHICRVNYKTHPIRKDAKLLLMENGVVGLTVQMYKQNYKERVIHTRDAH